MSKLTSDQRGFTGLETAIVLIAFVVVASVFAFATLALGLFSSDKSKETARAGLENALSTAKVHGLVTASATLNTVTNVNLVGQFVGTGNGNQKKFALPIDQMTPNLETIYLDGAPQTRDVDYTMYYTGGGRPSPRPQQTVLSSPWTTRPPWSY